ncbi:MAG: hypothetical protein WA194_09555 [Patescibacteria group bacterium]
MKPNVETGKYGGRLSQEAGTLTPTSEIVFAVRDEAERRGISIGYDTLTAIVAPNAELYRTEMLTGSVFVENALMPPSILRVRAKLRNEMPGVEGFGK